MSLLAFPSGLKMAAEAPRTCSWVRQEGGRRWGSTKNICSFYKEVKAFQGIFWKTSAYEPPITVKGSRKVSIQPPPLYIRGGGWEWELVEVSPKAEPETRTWGQVAYS